MVSILCYVVSPLFVDLMAIVFEIDKPKIKTTVKDNFIPVIF